MINISRPVSNRILCAIAGACGAAAFIRLGFELHLTDVIHYDLYFSHKTSVFLYLCAILSGAVAGFSATARCRLILLPLLFLLPGFLFSDTFAFAVLAAAVAGAVGFQVGRFYPPSECLFKKEWCIPLIILLFLYSGAVGYIYQVKAFYSWHFLYNDWAEYAEYYLRGKLTYSACGHWNVFPTFAGHLLFKLLPSPEALFLLNSLLIAVGIPLAAVLALVWDLKWRGAMFFAVIATFLPVFTHQNLCSFYGYHPVVWLIPAGLVFFIFEARKNLSGMVVCGILMLLVQETSAVLWIGWGLYKMTEKKKFWYGLGIFLTGVLLFLFLSRLSDNLAYYGQAGRYHHLGTTMVEIALSPFLRPAAFWNTVSDKHSIYFTIVLLLPLGVAVFPRWRALTVILPVLAGILLQNYPSNKTVASQYGLEISVFLLGLAISSTGLIRQKKLSLPPGFKISNRRYVPAVLCALLGAAAVSYVLWGYSFRVGKWRFKGDNIPVGGKIIRWVGNLPDMQAVYDRLCRSIPADARLLASSRVRSRFVFRNKTFPVYSPRLPGDVIVVDLDDLVPSSPLRKTLFFADNVHLTDVVNYRGIRLLVYRVSQFGIAKRPLPFLRKANDVIGYRGVKVAEDKHFDIRLLPVGQKIFLTARIKNTPPADADFIIRLSGGKEQVFNVCFAHGVLPASGAEAEQVFLFQLPVNRFQSASVQINRAE